MQSTATVAPVSPFAALLHGKTRILAPLVGGSELTYRLLCRRYGAQITYTEMCQAHYFNNVDAAKRPGAVRFQFDPTDRPLILQVAAAVDEADDVVRMVRNPLFVGHIDAVDLNCGCPQGFAMKRGIGAALAKHPDAFVELVRKISVGIAPMPLSVKLRLHDSVDYTVALLRRLIDAGAQCVTLHGRYAYQKGEKRGVCDWAALRAVRDALPAHIPFIANGDIAKPDDFAAIVATTGAAAGMSGYGALLNPGLFSTDAPPPSLATMLTDYLTLARQHVNKLVDVQRHVAWMIKSHSSKSAKAELFQAHTVDELVAVLNKHLGLQLVAPTEGVDHIVYGRDIDAITDPARKARVRKKVRRDKRKLEDRKRQREEKEANAEGRDIKAKPAPPQ